MSSFTIKLKDVIRLTNGTTEIADDGISRLIGGNIGLDYYPCFDNDYKPILTGKIIDHYFNREIGLESIQMFQLAMRRKMNEIMPYYNKMYFSAQMEYDPLKTVDLSTISHGTVTDSATTNVTADTSSDTTGKSRTVNSNTPQTQLSADEDYATAGVDANSDTKATGNSTQDTTSSNNGTSDNSVSVSGYQAVPATLITLYRDSIINVDLMVLSELQELFMNVWDTGDTYSTRNWMLI